MSPKNQAVPNGNGVAIHEYSKKQKLYPKSLPEKTFEIRASLLTDLFENPHIKTVKHVFAASLVAFMVNNVAHDYFENGEINFGFSLISLGFGGIHIAFLLWIVINFATILVYYCFKIWINIKINLTPKSHQKILVDVGGLILLMGFYAFMFRLIENCNAYFKFSMATGFVTCLEQTRLLMKVHAFIRTNLNKIWEYKQHSEQELKIAPLSHFIYFLFAPTLVYRDEYPRVKHIRWRFVLERFLELVGVIFYYSFILNKFFVQPFKEIGIRKYSWGEVILLILDNQLAGILCFLCAFYVTLHSTQNLVGELLRFGDRLTYKDWWTSTNYSRYFRTWNTLVGDWLYEYVYRDCCEYIVPGNRTFAKIMVFVISAVVHEWVLTHTCGFFFPALLVVFLFAGIICSMLKPPNVAVFNVLVWYSIIFGNGLIISLYAMEAFARINCPLQNESFRDTWVPRLFLCNCIG